MHLMYQPFSPPAPTAAAVICGNTARASKAPAMAGASRQVRASAGTFPPGRSGAVRQRRARLAAEGRITRVGARCRRRVKMGSENGSQKGFHARAQIRAALPDSMARRSSSGTPWNCCSMVLLELGQLET
jgi:hypothetical protein